MSEELINEIEKAIDDVIYAEYPNETMGAAAIRTIKDAGYSILPNEPKPHVIGAVQFAYTESRNFNVGLKPTEIETILKSHIKEGAL